MAQQPPAEHSVQPYYIRRRQDWALGNVRQSHIQSLYSFGEPALFTLMWKVEDFEAGLVTRCQRCRSDPRTIEGRIQAVYKQPLDARCPVCYGTTFTGGIRAQIVRPALFSDTDEDERKSPRGVVHNERATVESTNDFRSRTGDFVFRRDGSRWQLGTPRRQQIRTGYEHPTQDATSVGYFQIPASREDETSVAYSLPPSQRNIIDILDNPDLTPDATLYEQINGPLIPDLEFQ